ncbi:MAG: RIP metalloprotease RseP, partial [Verrucomicrobiota bacterium]
MAILNIIYVVVAVILLFGAAVFVHEYGHYWMARRRGLKIEGFSIGFGPKIFSWMHDGVEWSWRWIPAGGFVKLPQMVTSDALEGKAGEGTEALPSISPWSKILVALAGPVMNLIFAFLIAGVIYFVGLPVAVNPSVVGHVDEKSEEFKLGIREGDLIVKVDGQMAKSWQDVQMVVALARTNVLEVITEREGLRMTNHLTAEVNDVLGLKMLNLDPRDHPVVASVQSGSPAEQAGLKENDRFISFAGIPIVGQQQLIDTIKKRGGEPTQVVVQRGKETLTLTVTPKIIDPEKKTGRIGAVLTSDTTLVYRVMKPGPKPWELVADVWDKTVKTFSALLHHKETGVGAKDLSGPVGILAMLAAWVNTDYRLALNFLVLLNVNLAILNLLPIPVLDGGHILLAIIERIRRRPINGRFIEYTTTAFAVLLISFMLYVTFFDLRRFSLFKAMFKKDVQIEHSDEPAKAEPASAK